MITSRCLRDKFGDLYDPVRLDLDADKNGIYRKDTGLAWLPVCLGHATSFARSKRGAVPSRVYKVSYYAAENDSAMKELEAILKLQQAGVAGVPKIRRLGILEKGGLWAELEGIENARSLDREISEGCPGSLM